MVCWWKARARNTGLSSTHGVIEVLCQLPQTHVHAANQQVVSVKRVHTAGRSSTHGAVFAAIEWAPLPEHVPMIDLLPARSSHLIGHCVDD